MAKKKYTEEEVKELCQKAHGIGFDLAERSARTTRAFHLEALGHKSLDELRFNPWWDKNKKK